MIHLKLVKKNFDMTENELNKEIERLHKEGKRAEVIELMRKYGLFINEDDVADYLNFKEF